MSTYAIGMFRAPLIISLYVLIVFSLIHINILLSKAKKEI